MTTIRVLIADDHAVLRAGLGLLINAQSDMEVVGEAADGPGAVRSARATAPHVVLLDLSMPGARFTRTIEQLVLVAPGARVLVLTMHDDPAYMRAALQAGASGYIVKQAADVELLTAIRAVHRGRTFVDLTRPAEPPRPHEARPASGEAPAIGPPRPLSPREAEVLRLLAQGHTNQEAADQLAVSVKTVETYRRRLSEKLGLKSRAQLFRFAVERGLFVPDAVLPADQ
ncbi:MAG TPA: response regulator transcription factor [Gemmatimonadales bacterium]|jgi:DNA-binding NarL/FixJ family response regulator|nr:response regulator transcription factor [Gemmatimonadales bacterium]